MKRHIDFYLSCMRIAILGQIQYRANNYFYMVGTILEPTIYLVVWSTIANSQGGSVGGYTLAHWRLIMWSGLWCAK
jgi:ABC-2 type transport system permease protein